MRGYLIYQNRSSPKRDSSFYSVLFVSFLVQSPLVEVWCYSDTGFQTHMLRIIKKLASASFFIIEMRVVYKKPLKSPAGKRISVIGLVEATKRLPNAPKVPLLPHNQKTLASTSLFCYQETFFTRSVSLIVFLHNYELSLPNHTYSVNQ